MDNYMIEMVDICKSFGNLKANDNITLKLKKGEIHALLGENGAGKSTLMSILFGLYQADSGVIKIDGEVVDDTGAGDAFNGGVLHGIAAGMPAHKAVTLGSIVAGLQIRGIGAIKSTPSHDEVYQIFKGQND